MKLNDIETEVEESFKLLRRDLEVKLSQWVLKKLMKCKSHGKFKEVKIKSGMGTWVFMVNGEYVDVLAPEKYKDLLEIDETLKLMAGEHELYLVRDITV